MKTVNLETSTAHQDKQTLCIPERRQPVDMLTGSHLQPGNSKGGVPSVPASGLVQTDPLEEKKPSQHCPLATVTLACKQNLPPSQAWQPSRLLKPGRGL